MTTILKPDQYGPEKTEVVVWHEIWMTGVFKWKEDISDDATRQCYNFNFYLYEIVGFSDDGTGEWTKPSYKIKGAMSSGEDTPNLEESEPMIDGYLKWDGCCEWKQMEQEHFCGWRNFVQLHQAFKNAYLWGNSKFGFDYLDELPKKTIN